MFRWKFLTAALVAAVAALAGPAVSQAGFTVTVSDGTNSQTFASSDGKNISGSVQFGSLLVSINASTNTPGSNLLGTISSQTLDVQNVGGTLAATTLTVTSEATGFDLEKAPFSVLTAMSSSNLKGTGAGYTSFDGTKVTGSDVSLSGPGYDKSTAVLTTGPSQFTLSNTMILKLNASSGGSATSPLTLANVTLDTQVVAAPAPGGLILALTAVPFLGAIRRRLRKPATEAV